jgi:hypothetical protein
MKAQVLLGRGGLAAGLTSLSLLLLPVAAHAQGAPPPTSPAPAAPTAPAAEPAPSPSIPNAGTDVTPATPPPPDTAAAAPATDPTAAAAAPTDDKAAGAADAEAAALEAQLAAEQTEGADGFKLDIYGFADFTYGIEVEDFIFAPPFNSFAVGNLNVYLASSLGDSWQSLAEVRFSYLPHGATPTTGDTARIDTSTPDYTKLGRPTRWGGVMIERAYLEYLAHPLVNIRAGHWLTPYGIWNVDHGSPVIVGVRRPFIVGEALLPESQTGIEVYGTHHFDPIRLGYHLTLSNGRGPIDTYQDLNNNKAVGWRLFANADTKAGNITLGYSGYAGRYTDRTTQFGFDSEGMVEFTYPVTSDYKELSMGLDLKYEFEGLLVQGEGIFNDVVYDELRPEDTFVPTGPAGWVPDYRRIGVYGLAGYRFPFLGIMPFAGAEFYDSGRGQLRSSGAFWGGLNVRPTPRVVLKAQYTRSWYPDPPPEIPEGAGVSAVDLQAAWSF